MTAEIEIFGYVLRWSDKVRPDDIDISNVSPEVRFGERVIGRVISVMKDDTGVYATIKLKGLGIFPTIRMGEESSQIISLNLD